MRRCRAGGSVSSSCDVTAAEEAWIVPKAAAEGLSVQRFLVESAIEGRPSLLARRALYREFFAARRDLHGSYTNLSSSRTCATRNAKSRQVSRTAWLKWRPPWTG
jgi:hypothetical protein